MSTQTDAVRAYILSNFPVADPSSVADDASLMELGIVDSTGLLEVFEWLKDEYSIEVADADMVPENFDSIARIAAYIARKTG
ncbi:MAG: acyl carrier protein [Myxococcales bacterium]|nr:acyl carrier protein [Myxococcales bacterium]